MHGLYVLLLFFLISFIGDMSS